MVNMNTFRGHRKGRVFLHKLHIAEAVKDFVHDEIAGILLVIPRQAS